MVSLDIDEIIDSEYNIGVSGIWSFRSRRAIRLGPARRHGFLVDGREVVLMGFTISILFFFFRARMGVGTKIRTSVAITSCNVRFCCRIYLLVGLVRSARPV